MHQKIAEVNVDYIFISDFNKVEGPNWHADSNNRASILSASNTRLDNPGNGKADFRWVEANGIRMYS